MDGEAADPAALSHEVLPPPPRRRHRLPGQFFDRRTAGWRITPLPLASASPIALFWVDLHSRRADSWLCLCWDGGEIDNKGKLPPPLQPLSTRFFVFVGGSHQPRAKRVIGQVGKWASELPLHVAHLPLIIVRRQRYRGRALGSVPEEGTIDLVVRRDKVLLFCVASGEGGRR